MILDAQLLFSDAQSVTATAVSTNVVDMGNAGDHGTGEPLKLQVSLAAAMVGAGATVAVTIEQDDNEAFSSATTVQTIGTFAAVSAAGTKFVAYLQPGVLTERFIRLRYTVSGTLTSSSFDAFMLLNNDAVVYYADAITIS